VTPTEDLRTELRELLDEVVPAGGTESDTRFTDTQLDRLLSRAKNVYAAASEGWTLKAAMLPRELGQVASRRLGQESVDRVNLQTAVRSALSLADMYRELARTSGSVVLSVTKPEVL